MTISLTDPCYDPCYGVGIAGQAVVRIQLIRAEAHSLSRRVSHRPALSGYRFGRPALRIVLVVVLVLVLVLDLAGFDYDDEDDDEDDALRVYRKFTFRVRR